MNIGEAAKASGVSAKMIRHYESIGLIPPAERAESGYRVYSQQAVWTLKFVRRARDLNFSMEQIRELLALWGDKERSSADVKRLALDHVEALERRMLELREMTQTLRHLAHCCQGDDRPDCPIIEDLSAGHEAELPKIKPTRRRPGLSVSAS